MGGTPTLLEETMRLLAAVVVVALMMILPGCAGKNQGNAREPAAEVSDSERWRKTDEAVVNALAQSVAESARGHGGVTHVVLMWLKTPGDPTAIAKVIQTSREFRQIPGVMSVRVGRPMPSTRPVVDSSF